MMEMDGNGSTRIGIFSEKNQTAVILRPGDQPVKRVARPRTCDGWKLNSLQCG